MTDPSRTSRPSAASTSPNPATSEWLATRGEKWRKHLAGMEAMLAPVDVPLLAALPEDASITIADLGCGGGQTTLELARRAAPGTVVHGFDIAPELIELARGRLAPGQTSVAFEVADLATAAAPVDPYGLLVSRFGLMFFDDPPAAFANLLRWLAPGGRFAFAVWGSPDESASLTLARDVVASVVTLPKTDPDAPGPFRYADADKLVALLSRAGFGDVEVSTWRGELPIGGMISPADAAAFVLASFSSFDELLTEAGEGARKQAHAQLTARFAEHHHDGAVWLGAAVHIVSGTREHAQAAGSTDFP